MLAFGEVSLIRDRTLRLEPELVQIGAGPGLAIIVELVVSPIPAVLKLL